MKARLFILLSGLFFVLGAVAQNIYPPDQYKVKVGDMLPILR